MRWFSWNHVRLYGCRLNLRTLGLHVSPTPSLFVFLLPPAPHCNVHPLQEHVRLHRHPPQPSQHEVGHSNNDDVPPSCRKLTIAGGKKGLRHRLKGRMLCHARQPMREPPFMSHVGCRRGSPRRVRRRRGGMVSSDSVAHTKQTINVIRISTPWEET